MVTSPVCGGRGNARTSVTLAKPKRINRWSKRVSPQQPQVNDSIGQGIRVRGGHAGIRFETLENLTKICDMRYIVATLLLFSACCFGQVLKGPPPNMGLCQIKFQLEHFINRWRLIVEDMACSKDHSRISNEILVGTHIVACAVVQQNSSPGAKNTACRDSCHY